MNGLADAGKTKPKQTQYKANQSQFQKGYLTALPQVADPRQRHSRAEGAGLGGVVRLVAWPIRSRL